MNKTRQIIEALLGRFQSKSGLGHLSLSQKELEADLHYGRDDKVYYGQLRIVTGTESEQL